MDETGKRRVAKQKPSGRSEMCFFMINVYDEPIKPQLSCRKVHPGAMLDKSTGGFDK